MASNEYDQVRAAFPASFDMLFTDLISQALLEDRRTNRLDEAVNVFDTIVNNRQYEKISIILFLNKTDLLTGKAV